MGDDEPNLHPGWCFSSARNAGQSSSRVLAVHLLHAVVAERTVAGDVDA